MNIFETYESHHERYFAWVYERQLMWYRRMVLKLPQPWTDDPVLSTWRFTNSYRELDRGTLYCHDVVMTDEMPLEAVLLRLVTYRIFNRVATFDKIFRPISYGLTDSIPWRSISEALSELHKTDPIFTGAHTVSSYQNIKGDASKADKIIEFLEEFYSGLETITHEVRALKGSMRDLHKYLQKFDGIGDFLAYEIVTDLAYSKHVDFDEDQWANAGPGCKAGLALLYPDRKGLSELELMYDLQKLQGRYFNTLGMTQLSLIVPTSVHSTWLTLRNIEGGCCEYYKYDRCASKGAPGRQPFKLGDGYAWVRDTRQEAPLASSTAAVVTEVPQVHPHSK